MLNKLKNINNDIKLLLKKSLLFLLFSKVLLMAIMLIVFLPGISIVYLFNGFVTQNSSQLDFLDGVEYVFYFLIITSPFAYYLYAKLFGIFKIIDKNNFTFLKKFLFIILLSILLFAVYSLGYNDLFNKEQGLFYNAGIFLFYGFALVPAFFLYKFFQFLTKKYPHPFEKIGYYSSVEFYKTLFRKLFGNLKEKFKSKFGK